MAQLPYDPFRQLNHFRREIDSLLQDFPLLNRDSLLGIVRIDVHETADEVIAICDLPGIENKNDLQINIENNVLRISGKVKRSKEVKEERMHRQERIVGSFERAVSLPCPVSQEGIVATYKNGVLEVKMPKLENEQKRNIDIDFY